MELMSIVRFLCVTDKREQTCNHYQDLTQCNFGRHELMKERGRSHRKRGEIGDEICRGDEDDDHGIDGIDEADMEILLCMEDDDDGWVSDDGV